jgi:hypothetical protein
MITTGRRLRQLLLIGVLLLAAGQAPAGAAAAAGNTQVVAVSGSPAPDGNGAFSSAALLAGGLNDAGQVVFTAQLTGTAGGTTDNSGIFRGGGTGLVQIARAGQSVGAGGVFSGFSSLLGNSAINPSGQVAFPALLSTANAATGLFRSSGAAGSLTQIARQGQPTPSGNGFFGPVASVSSGPTLNNAGQVAFNVQIINSTNNQRSGLFRSDGALITPIALLGTTASGTNLFGSLLAGPVLNDAGTVAFATGLLDANNATLGSAVALSTGAGTALYAVTGQSTPDGQGFFNSPLAVSLNQLGQLVFVESVRTAVGSYNGAYFVTGNGLAEIARTGQPAPGIPGETLEQFEWVCLNNAGQVALTGITCCHAGIFRWNRTGGVLENIVAAGQPAPDGNGTLTLLNGLSDSPVEFNDAGQMAFASAVMGSTQFNDFGIFLHDDRLGLLPVARYGDPLLGSTITRLSLATGASKANAPAGAAGREFSPLNNRGQVAYTFALADGRSGVAVWTPTGQIPLRMSGITIVGRDVRVTWSSAGGLSIVVQASANLSTGYVDISPTLLTAGSGQATNSFVDLGGAAKGPARFYRVRLGA